MKRSSGGEKNRRPSQGNSYALLSKGKKSSISKEKAAKTLFVGRQESVFRSQKRYGLLTRED
jgi:hypothetical protein